MSQNPLPAIRQLGHRYGLRHIVGLSVAGRLQIGVRHERSDKLLLFLRELSVLLDSLGYDIADVTDDSVQIYITAVERD